MKQEKNELTLFWDDETAHLLRSKSYLDKEKSNLEDYFEFLEQFKPHPHELRDAKIYNEIFTL